jgi:adenylyl-sulfate kinase
LTLWLTGLPGSGKSTIAFAAEERLVGRPRAAYVLDGDNLRHGLNADLGFSPSDRAENVRRVGAVALLLADAGLVVFVPVVSPYAADRAQVRASHEEIGVRFLEVHVDAPLEVCEERDPKGLYRKARAGTLPGMTGIDDPYEAPQHPDLRLQTAVISVDESVDILLKAIDSNGTGEFPRN